MPSAKNTPFTVATPKALQPSRPLSVVMLGASGAVGQAAWLALSRNPKIGPIQLLLRRNVPGMVSPGTHHHVVDVFDPSSYRSILAGQDAAICTFGVGESSKVSHDELVRVDKTAVLAFASTCKQAGVRHFEMLSAVAADARSASFYLRVKGELNEALTALGFERLSLFQPSMILTPTNRYGFSQGLTLAMWPKLQPVLAGPLRKYRGIAVEQLGASMANNLFTPGHGTEHLEWDQFNRINQSF